MAEQYNVTPEQKRFLEEKAKRRLVLRQEFLKQASDPYRHASHEGGTVFDPSISRFMAMRISTYEHFKPNFKNSIIGASCFVIPLLALMYAVKTSRDKREDMYRRGEVAYKDRLFKFI